MVRRMSTDDLRNRPLTSKDRATLRAILRPIIHDAIKANGGWEEEYETWGPKAQQLYRIFMSVAAERPIND